MPYRRRADKAFLFLYQLKWITVPNQKLQNSTWGNTRIPYWTLSQCKLYSNNIDWSRIVNPWLLCIPSVHKVSVQHSWLTRQTRHSRTILWGPYSQGYHLRLACGILSGRKNQSVSLNLFSHGAAKFTRRAIKPSAMQLLRQSWKHFWMVSQFSYLSKISLHCNFSFLSSKENDISANLPDFGYVPWL